MADDGRPLLPDDPRAAELRAALRRAGDDVLVALVADRLDRLRRGGVARALAGG